MSELYAAVACLLLAATCCLSPPSAQAQAPASTPFPSWTAALQRAAAGGENARVAFIGDSNFDAPRGFYLPLRLAFENQSAGSAGVARGGAGLAALTGFRINDLDIRFNSSTRPDGSALPPWQELDDDRGFADPTHVGTEAGNDLSVTGTANYSLFDRAQVYLDRVPGGGVATVEFINASGAVLHSRLVDLGGVTAHEAVRVDFDGFDFAAGNRVTVRVDDPGTAGVHLLGVVTDRKPNNSVQVHKVAYAGWDAERWADRITGSGAQDFYTSLDLAIVSLGTNDMRRGNSDAFQLYEDNMIRLLAYFRAAGVPVILTAVADMAPTEFVLGQRRAFGEVTARVVLRKLAGAYGAAYYDLGELHGDYPQIVADGIYRDGDPVHFKAFNLTDPAAQRHGPFFFNAIAGRPTADRSAANQPDPSPSIITAEGCGPVVVRTVDGSGAPAIVYFRAPAPDYEVVAAIDNGVELGQVRVQAFGNAGARSRTSAGGLTYGSRQITITPEHNRATTVYLPVTDAELASLDDPSIDDPAQVRWRRSQTAGACGPYSDDGAEQSLEGVAAVDGGHFMRFGVPAFSQFYMAAASQSALPVELVAFTAVAKTGHNELRWTSASEVDFDYYAVERSRDAGAWEALGRVLAQAPAGGGAVYHFRDVTAPGGTCYYRLVLNDRDGSVDHSAVVAVDRAAGETAAMRIAPNPALRGGALTLRFATARHGRRVVLRDVTGRIVAEVAAGDLTQSLSLAGLPSGVYAISQVGSSEQARRVMIR